jgi:beta-glucosidase
VIETVYLRPSADSKEHGLKGEYFQGRDFAGQPKLTRVDKQIAFRWDRGSPTDDLVARGELAADKAIGADDFSVRWTGQILPPVSGKYELSVSANDGFRLYVDGKLVDDSWQMAPRLQSKSSFVELQAGKPYDIKLEYFEADRDAEVRLAWRRPGAKPPLEEALDVARAADAVIFVGGLTGDVEGEEMKVSYPGFAGGDRTDLRLPATQQKLLEALYATGKPVILVLTTGSALGVDWAKEKLPAILVAWYPGQRGGNAVADVLFGDVNPSGRLPVTFYKADEKLPAFDDYSMQGRTYRYFKGEPLYPFGYGLSYTKFEYSDVQVNRASAGAADTIHVSVKVKNAGTRAGDEVVQLYAHAVDSKQVRSQKELRGVERVSLKAGETRDVAFDIKPNRDLTYYDDQKKSYAVDPGAYELQLGGSSADVRLTSRVSVK